MDKSVVAVIMAGGLGKRMESNIPKVLHKIGGISMINHILLKLKVLQNLVNLEKVIIVVGKYEKQIRKAIEECIGELSISYVNQNEPLGTGHAIQCCREELLKFPNSDILILSGDVPLLSPYTMLNLLKNPSLVKLITTKLTNPDGYGRVVTNNGVFDKIVEQKDCNSEELEILNINGGIYSINSKILCKYLPYLKNENKQKEFYLTDIVEIIKREENVQIGLFEIESEKRIEIIGVNTISQLKELEQLINKKN
jgi:UDP-N-acetylglucosamine diphosphorylase/glucosamine-1-phosphate N-acetyltransferase